MSFANLSNTYLPNIEEIACELLGVSLANTGEYVVVERERIAQIMSEQNLYLTGRFELESVGTQLGQLMSADLLAAGSILSCDSYEETTINWGVKTTIKTVQMLVSIKVWDVAQGSVYWAGTEEAEGVTVKIAWVTTIREGEPAKVLESICSSAATKIADCEKAVQPGVPSVTITVPIQTTPPGADIEVDGLYVGTTPLQYPLNEAQIYRVRLSYAGYEVWEKQVSVHGELVIDVNLTPSSSEESD